MSQKTSTPSGMRDFLPIEMVRRHYIFDTIRSIFLLHGFEPIETPAMENLSTLLGKYGDEGDKLLYKVLNSGNPFDKFSQELLSLKNHEIVALLCEKGLRYDLTVPFARYVVQHRNDLIFPFRRFQIQPVWRADRPQKGRYREFYQCDVDIVGSTSLYHEAELVEVADEIFRKFGLAVVIKINHRKILGGISEYIGHEDKLTSITTAIDKIDKIGFEKVSEELRTAGIDDTAIEKLRPLLYLEGNNREKLAILSQYLSASEEGLQGIADIRELLDIVDKMNIVNMLELDLSLARGLSYYTGAIFEIKAKEVVMGSISGGGRYDNLTKLFGLNGISGVGISFGADRIYDVLLQLGLFDNLQSSVTDILFLNFGTEVQSYVFDIIRKLRQSGKKVAYYPENIKIGKQFDYANKCKIGLVGIVGVEEMESNTIKIKNMESGEQVVYQRSEYDTP